jgi:hypothetical protein
MKKGIIIRHSILSGINKEDVQKIVDKYENDNVYIIDNIEIQPLTTTRDEIHKINWVEAIEKQRKQYEENIKPILEKDASITVYYFGFAPTTLAMHLGYLMQNYTTYKIAFKMHTGNKEWYFEKSAENIFEFNDDIFQDTSKRISRGEGDAILKISTSFQINTPEVDNICSTPLIEYDLLLKNIDVDIFSAQKDIFEFEKTLMNSLDNIKQYYPKTNNIYFFAAIPVGIAFFIGTKINPTIYAPIHLFQYYDKKYYPTVILQKATTIINELSEANKLEADEIRAKLAQHLVEDIHKFVKSENKNDKKSWLDAIGNLSDENISQNWHCLPQIYESILNEETQIKMGSTNTSDSFEYSFKNSEWHLNDELLLALAKRKDINLTRAFRLFIFHESLHFSTMGHSFLGKLADGIGAFPKVVEEVDYQADVWAMLYEYVYTKNYLPNELGTDYRKFFCTIIEHAIETMWSFNDEGKELKEIQIRRMNRFLIWYWQLVYIEKLSKNTTIQKIADILMNKPVLEFAGLKIKSNGTRISYDLTDSPSRHWEFAIFTTKNKIRRLQTNDIDNFVAGFRERNSSKIKKALETLYSNLE